MTEEFYNKLNDLHLSIKRRPITLITKEAMLIITVADVDEKILLEVAKNLMLLNWSVYDILLVLQGTDDPYNPVYFDCLLHLTKQAIEEGIKLDSKKVKVVELFVINGDYIKDLHQFINFFKIWSTFDKLYERAIIWENKEIFKQPLSIDEAKNILNRLQKIKELILNDPFC